MLLDKKELLAAIAASKRRYRTIHLPACDADVRIRSLTEGELSRHQRRLINKSGKPDLQSLEAATRRLFCLCVVNECGDRLLSDSDETELSQMDAMDASVFFKECSEHCGLDASDLGVALDSVEDHEKN